MQLNFIEIASSNKSCKYISRAGASDVFREGKELISVDLIVDFFR